MSIRNRVALLSPPVLVLLLLIAALFGTNTHAQNLLPVVLSPITILASPPPAGSAEELPGLGHKFELYGTATDDKDPQNPTNDVVSITSPGVGLAFRRLPPGIRIEALDNQLNLKYFFLPPKSCGGGSPRVTLLIDVNGDNQFDNVNGPDAAAHGHVNAPLTLNCLSGRWYTEDLTDETPGRWEVTPGGRIPGVIGYVNWDTLEAAVAAIPTHQVLAGFLLDGESCDFYPAACGKGYYDLLTIENRTMENDQDTVRGQ